MGAGHFQSRQVLALAPAPCFRDPLVQLAFAAVVALAGAVADATLTLHRRAWDKIPSLRWGIRVCLLRTTLRAIGACAFDWAFVWIRRPTKVRLPVHCHWWRYHLGWRCVLLGHCRSLRV